MAQTINTNIASINAQRNLETNSSSLQTSLQRLSSGLRINSAKDDSAGLAITERMSAQIRGLNQAARNANDAISLAQTAEGAISGMSDNLQRLRELSVQSANATNSAADRASIQAEVAQLVSEIDRVAKVTEFNGIKLLDGSLKNQSFQVGANAGQTIEVTLGNASALSLGSGDSASLSSTGSSTALSAGDLVLNGISVGGSIASSDSASSTGNATSGIAKAAAINAISSNTGVIAKADITTAVATVAMSAGVASAGTIVINGASIAIATSTTTTASRTNIVAAINQFSVQTGVVATDSGSDAVGIKLTAADGRNINVASNTVLTSTTGITVGTYYSGVTLTSNREITVTSSGTIANAGMLSGSYKTQQATASSIPGGSTAAMAGGDVMINGISVGSSAVYSYDTASTAGTLGASAMSKAAAINAVNSQTGVLASAQTEKLGAALSATSSAGTFSINGVATSTITNTGVVATDRATVVAAINSISSRTGVIATDLGGTTSGNSIRLMAADGRNIDITSTFTSESANTGLALGTTYGTVTLASSKAFSIEHGQNVTANAVSLNLGMNTGTYGAGRNGQSLSSIDVSTISGSNSAIVAIDNAINSLNNSRANLGSVINRFSSTVSNLGVATENISAAQSRIRDTDFAKETAKLSRGQILQQAGVAMLAQANALPNTILALLK